MAVLQVFVNVKSIGKRRPALSAVPYVLPGDVATLRDVITSIVKHEVSLYNAKEAQAVLRPFLTEAQMEDQSVAGKVGFGRIYADKKADGGKAIEAALQGFADGSFRVMVGEIEAKELDTPITIQDGDTLTFIRLTFLAGRLW